MNLRIYEDVVDFKLFFAFRELLGATGSLTSLFDFVDDKSKQDLNFKYTGEVLEQWKTLGEETNEIRIINTLALALWEYRQFLKPEMFTGTQYSDFISQVVEYAKKENASLYTIGLAYVLSKPEQQKCLSGLLSEQASSFAEICFLLNLKHDLLRKNGQLNSLLFNLFCNRNVRTGVQIQGNEALWLWIAHSGICEGSSSDDCVKFCKILVALSKRVLKSDTKQWEMLEMIGYAPVEIAYLNWVLSTQAYSLGCGAESKKMDGLRARTLHMLGVQMIITDDLSLYFEYTCVAEVFTRINSYSYMQKPINGEHALMSAVTKYKDAVDAGIRNELVLRYMLEKNNIHYVNIKDLLDNPKWSEFFQATDHVEYVGKLLENMIKSQKVVDAELYVKLDDFLFKVRTQRFADIVRGNTLNGAPKYEDWVPTVLASLIRNGLWCADEACEIAERFITLTKTGKDILQSEDTTCQEVGISDESLDGYNEDSQNEELENENSENENSEDEELENENSEDEDLENKDLENEDFEDECYDNEDYDDEGYEDEDYDDEDFEDLDTDEEFSGNQPELISLRYVLKATQLLLNCYNWNKQVFVIFLVLNRILGQDLMIKVMGKSYYAECLGIFNYRNTSSAFSNVFLTEELQDVEYLQELVTIIDEFLFKYKPGLYPYFLCELAKHKLTKELYKDKISTEVLETLKDVSLPEYLVEQLRMAIMTEEELEAYKAEQKAKQEAEAAERLQKLVDEAVNKVIDAFVEHSMTVTQTFEENDDTLKELNTVLNAIFLNTATKDIQVRKSIMDTCITQVMKLLELDNLQIGTAIVKQGTLYIPDDNSTIYNTLRTLIHKSIEYGWRSDMKMLPEVKMLLEKVIFSDAPTSDTNDEKEVENAKEVKKGRKIKKAVCKEADI